jgi:hypothetical protein
MVVITFLRCALELDRGAPRPGAAPRHAAGLTSLRVEKATGRRGPDRHDGTPSDPTLFASRDKIVVTYSYLYMYIYIYIHIDMDLCMYNYM